MLKKILNTTILFILIILYLVDSPFLYFNINYLSLILVLDFIGLLLFIYRREKYSRIKRRVLRLSTLFLLGFIIVHFQAYIDLLLGFLDVSQSTLWINKTSIIKGAFFSSIALNSFFVGYLYCKSRRSRQLRLSSIQYSIQPLKLINLLAFLIFLSQISPSYLNMLEYGSRDNSSLLGFAILFYETSFVALVVHLIKRKYTDGHHNSFKYYIKGYGYSFYIFIIYLTFVSLSGDRGPVIYLSLVFFLGYTFISGYRLSRIKVILIIVVMSVLTSVVGILRAKPSDSGIGYAYLLHHESRYYPKSFYPPTKELAGSVRTLQLAINNVPEKHDYFYGLMLFQNLSLIIPGFNGFINRQLNIKPEYLTSARYLSYVYLGTDRTWGVGTSAVADVYLDFGLIGIVILFLLFGICTRILELNIYVMNNFRPGLLILYVLFFGFSIYISRSNLLIPIVKFPYVLAFYYFPSFFKNNRV